ncbi:MAG: lytic transglycosylase domain-containing protein [Bacteroidota bacterium]
MKIALKKVTIALVSVIILAVAAKLFIFSDHLSKDTKSDEKYYDASKRFYKVFTVKIPEKVDFASEKVPLDKFYVREGLDRELLVNSFWHSNSLLMFKRAYRYLPTIDSILKANNVPTDFKYLAMIESALENVTSPAGASGFWQFLSSTGKQYGLEITTEIDERNHMEKATVAACKYLKAAYAHFKNWTLAAASYNMGVDGLDDVMTAQKCDNFYDLSLNKETQRYIYRILAIKLIYQMPVAYSFYLRDIDFYPQIPTYSVSVDSTVADWPDFAIKNKSNYRILKELNPWILKYTLTNKDRKKYVVKFPKPGFEKYTLLQSRFPESEHLFNDTLHIDLIR